MTIPSIILMVAPSALLVVTVLLGLYLFVCLKKQIRRLEQRLDTDNQGLTRQIEAAHSAVGELKVGLKEAEERTGVLVPPTPPCSGMNLNKRTQALRMSRRGERPEQIAAALGLPKREVELLVKVHRIVLCAD
ncbi:MAG: DUF2802 domain-containing protein [Acidobacteriales bacterium]|nr:DUF2802 domain-containing protein [Terriglobales bacterium]